MAAGPPPVHLHFIPTSASWANLVERWFRELTDKCTRRGSFASIDDLVADIDDYLAAHNDDPRPYGWTATAQSIIDKLSRCKAVFETLH